MARKSRIIIYALACIRLRRVAPKIWIRLFGKLVEPEGAATKVENVVVCRHLSLEVNRGPASVKS